MKTKQISQIFTLSWMYYSADCMKKQELADPPCILESVLSESRLPLQASLPCLSHEALSNHC